MYCVKCGASVREGQFYCNKCSRKMAAEGDMPPEEAANKYIEPAQAQEDRYPVASSEPEEDGGDAQPATGESVGAGKQPDPLLILQGRLPAFRRGMAINAAICVGGILVTALTYSNASVGGGSSYYIFWAAIVLGGFQFIKNAIYYSKTKSAIKELTERQRGA
jgi:hypothetical protein